MNMTLFRLMVSFTVKSRNNLLIGLICGLFGSCLQLYKFFFLFFLLLPLSPSSSTTFRCEPSFQYNLPLFPTISKYCLSGFRFYYKYNPLQPRPSIFLVVFLFPCSFHCSCCRCLGIRWFECFQHDHTILVGGILQYLSLTAHVIFFLTTIKLCE